MTETALSSTAPPTVDEALICPLCDYDLRATTEDRCPECGYRFDPAELRDPTRRLHPYAFEHHPKRNAWSFIRTLLAGLRPGRFWRKLFPTQPSRPRRLVFYWLLIVPICILPFALNVARAWAIVESTMNSERKMLQASWSQINKRDLKQFLGSYPTIQAYIDDVSPAPTSGRVIERLFESSDDTRIFARACALWIVWPWATFVVLMIFQASMRRASIKPIHVLRCVLYTSDTAVWISITMTLVIALDIYRNRWVSVGVSWGSHLGMWALALMALSFPLYALRLSAAYRHYLRFDWSFATALSTQIILLLICMILSVNMLIHRFS